MSIVLLLGVEEKNVVSAMWSWGVCICGRTCAREWGERGKCGGRGVMDVWGYDWCVGVWRGIWGSRRGKYACDEREDACVVGGRREGMGSMAWEREESIS